MHGGEPVLSAVGWAEAHRRRSEGLSRRRGFWDAGGVKGKNMSGNTAARPS